MFGERRGGPRCWSDPEGVDGGGECHEEEHQEAEGAGEAETMPPKCLGGGSVVTVLLAVFAQGVGGSLEGAYGAGLRASSGLASVGANSFMMV